MILSKRPFAIRASSFYHATHKMVQDDKKNFYKTDKKQETYLQPEKKPSFQKYLHLLFYSLGT